MPELFLIQNPYYLSFYSYAQRVSARRVSKEALQGAAEKLQPVGATSCK